jgi:hypothetical protein
MYYCDRVCASDLHIRALAHLRVDRVSFLGTTYQNGKNVPYDQKMYEMAVK